MASASASKVGGLVVVSGVGDGDFVGRKSGGLSSAASSLTVALLSVAEAS